MLQEEFNIDTRHIYATIEVFNVPSADTWKFRWVDSEGEMVLAESSGRYMEREKQYISGYFASLLKADSESNIIAVPGIYRVEYYHNQALIDSAEFIIKVPQIKVLEAELASSINSDGSADGARDHFMVGEDVFLSLKLNSFIEGSSLQVFWFSEQRELGRALIEIEHNQFQPVYQVIKLSEEVLPPGDYEAEVHINGAYNLSLEFNIELDTKTLEVFSDDIHHFSLKYPSWFEVSESITEESFHLKFSPQDFESNILMGLWVVGADTMPDADGWPGFADEVILKEMQNEYGLELIEESEQEGIYIYRYVGLNGEEWKLLLSFEDMEDSIYIFLGLADSYYAPPMQKIYSILIDSIEFEIEE